MMGLMLLEEEEYLSMHLWEKGPVSTKQEGSCLQARKRALIGAQLHWHLILGFQPPELRENKCLLFESHSEHIWLHGSACEILIPQAGIEPMLPEVEAWNPPHWTAREVPVVLCHHSSS